MWGCQTHHICLLCSASKEGAGFSCGEVFPVAVTAVVSGWFWRQDVLCCVPIPAAASLPVSADTFPQWSHWWSCEAGAQDAETQRILLARNFSGKSKNNLGWATNRHQEVSLLQGRLFLPQRGRSRSQGHLQTRWGVQLEPSGSLHSAAALSCFLRACLCLWPPKEGQLFWVLCFFPTFIFWLYRFFLYIRKKILWTATSLSDSLLALPAHSRIWGYWSAVIISVVITTAAFSQVLKFLMPMDFANCLAIVLFHSG